MLGLPIYRRGSTLYLHTRLNGRQFKRSLGTSDHKLAILRACQLLASTMKIDLSNIRKYEVDLHRGTVKADGPEDHARLLEALSALHGLVAGANAGTSVKTPLVATPSGLRLMEVLDKFFLLKTHLSQATFLAYKNTIAEFSGFLKNPVVGQIGVADVTRFQEHLAKVNKNTSRTIDNKIATIRALMNFAIKQGYYFQPNPAQNRSLLTKKQKSAAGYGIFEPADISLIYGSQTMRDARKSDPDFFWAMVLGLITGCRVSEITSLTPKQFRQTETGTHYIRITDSKTQAGIRDVPIPEALLSQGLAEFMEGKAQVFKYQLRLGKGSGNAVGKRFSRLLAELKIEGEKLVFHSLRKFANDYFLKKGVGLEARCQFFGHETNSLNVDVYSRKLTPDELYSAIKDAQFGLLVASR